MSPSPLADPSASPTPDPSASATPSPDPSPFVSPSPEPGVPATVATPVASLTIEQLRAKIVYVKARVRRLRHKVRRFAHRLAVERATARGYYVPLIRDVARANGISSSGLYGMMILESGGRATAVGGGGAYMGLFQYTWSTWQAAWNGWRTSSIFDPAAQIRATARALRLGYGPSMWPNTYLEGLLGSCRRRRQQQCRGGRRSCRSAARPVRFGSWEGRPATSPRHDVWSGAGLYRGETASVRRSGRRPGNRTRKPSRARDFESRASTSSASRRWRIIVPASQT